MSVLRSGMLRVRVRPGTSGASLYGGHAHARLSSERAVVHACYTNDADDGVYVFSTEERPSRSFSAVDPGV